MSKWRHFSVASSRLIFSPPCANILDKQGISPYDNPSQEHTGKQKVKTEVKSF